jgi:ribosomal protein S18 acetylase RimI-like enzyme
MNFTKILPGTDLSETIRVLNKSHLTVADEFGFTRETNPSNNAFIDAVTLNKQLGNNIELFQLMIDGTAAGCIAIEKSLKEENTFYIEKVSVLPEYRHKGYGIDLMNFAFDKIKNEGGRWVSIALIDSNKRLKDWYTRQGFTETGTKDFPHLPFRVCFMKKELLPQ